MVTEINASKFEQLKKWYRGVPDKKRYLEFVTAFLSIPVLLTVLITNTRNLNNQRNNEPSPSPATIVQSTPAIIVIAPESTPSPATPAPATPSTIAVTPDSTPIPATPVPSAECKKGVGPVSISYPQENDIVSGNPICVDVSRQSSDYCSIVWSYRINNGPWSEYLDKSICMYGLTSGQKQLQLKVRSVVVNEETMLNRNFVVADTTSNPTATGSANQ